MTEKSIFLGEEESSYKSSVIEQYKEGKISLERSAKELHLPISDFIELLANLGVKSPITYDDYLEGLKNVM